jgi:hypothetical protein
MRIIMFLLAAILLVGASMPAAAQGQGSSTEHFSIELLDPPGYCALDLSNPIDASLIALHQQGLGQTERIVLAAVECAQREAWRKPPYSPLDASVNIIAHSFEYEGLIYDERVRLPAKMCRLVRESSGQGAGETRGALDKRVTKALASLKVGEDRLIGVIDEQPAECFVVVVSRGYPVDAQPVALVRVRATTAINGRVLQFYQSVYVSAGKELPALDRAVNTLKAQIAADLAANK